VSGYITKQRRILAHLKQVEFLPICRALNLQHDFASKANLLFGDRDGVPSEATPPPLLNTGTSISEFKLSLVFPLLKLHQCTHMTQLMFNSAWVGGDNVDGSQRKSDLTVQNFKKPLQSD
jgi:hypothetical protein